MRNYDEDNDRILHIYSLETKENDLVKELNDKKVFCVEQNIEGRIMFEWGNPVAEEWKTLGKETKLLDEVLYREGPYLYGMGQADELGEKWSVLKAKVLATEEGMKFVSDIKFKYPELDDIDISDFIKLLVDYCNKDNVMLDITELKRFLLEKNRLF